MFIVKDFLIKFFFKFCYCCYFERIISLPFNLLYKAWIGNSVNLVIDYFVIYCYTLNELFNVISLWYYEKLTILTGNMCFRVFLILVFNFYLPWNRMRLFSLLYPKCTYSVIIFIIIKISTWKTKTFYWAINI